MKAQNHHKGATRAKKYQGRSHTKKHKSDIEQKQSASLKPVTNKNRRTGKTKSSKITYTHYRHCEKPNQSFENNSTPKHCLISKQAPSPLERAGGEVKKVNKLTGSKISPLSSGRNFFEGTAIGGPKL